MVALTLVWSKVSPWTSWPVAELSQVVLEQTAPMWVRSIHSELGKMEVETTVEMPVQDAGGRLGELSVEADPGRYAYGLPIFLALLFAARLRGRAGQALLGYLLLLPAQVFSLTMFVLIQIVLYAKTSAEVLKVPHWQIEAIVYGYQVGALVVPTLVPIMLWLWVDKKFFIEVVAPGMRAHLVAPAGSAAEPVPLSQEVLQPMLQTLSAEAVTEQTPLRGAVRPDSEPTTRLTRQQEESLISSDAAAALPKRRSDTL